MSDIHSRLSPYTMRTDVAARAENAADNFVASLDIATSATDAAMIRLAYTAGWIQGAYAGANEARLDVCGRRTGRSLRTCR